MADRYRKVRRVLKKLRAHIKAVEQLPNRAQRRHEMFNGSRTLELYDELKTAKRNV